MSNKYVYNAIQQKDLTSIEKLIFIILSSRADQKGQCFPLVSTIAKDANCSTRTVHRALRCLESKGKVKSKANYIGNEKRVANTYTVRMTQCRKTSDTMADITRTINKGYKRQYVTGTSLSSIAG